MIGAEMPLAPALIQGGRAASVNDHKVQIINMSLEDSLTPLKIGDIAVGKPLPWAIYGPNKKLLLRQGFVLETQKQVEALIKDGAYRGMPSTSSGLRRKASPPQAEEKAAENTAARSFPFEELKPKVGDAFQIQVQDERYAVRLIGYVKGRTIIVSTPMSDGGVVLLREGQPVVARSFSGKDAYAFPTSVLRVCSAPLSYMHLAYPRAVQSVTVRKTARAEFRLIGAVSNVSNPEFASGSKPVLISDMSINGASFTAGDLVGEKGDRLNLAFRVKLDDIDASMDASVSCIVRSLLNDSDIGSESVRFRYGVQFVDVQTDVSLLLQNMIYQKLLEDA